MSDCERHESTLLGFVSGELDERGIGELLTHCRSCADCRRLLELHRDLLALGSRRPEPDEPRMSALRGEVLRRIDAPSERAGRRREARRVAVRSLLAIAATLVVFFAGFLARAPRVAVSPAEPLVGLLNAEAVSNRRLADVENSPFTYSNISIRKTDETTVALDFDVTTHIHLVEPLRSELVRDLLVQSLLNPSSIGTRLKSMSYAEALMEPKVRDALAFAMRRDPSLAVRLAAVTALADQLDQPEVQSAMLEALGQDASVQVRLLALDSLTAHRVDHERIRRVIDQSDRQGDEALRVRLLHYERQL